MAQKTPQLKDNKIYIWDEYEGRYVVNGRDDITDKDVWPYWLEVLKTIKSLRIEYTERNGQKLTFSAYKLAHPLEGKATADGHVMKHGRQWIAQKQVNKKRRRMYIGKDENMTAKRLKQVAKEINQTRLV